MRRELEEGEESRFERVLERFRGDTCSDSGREANQLRVWVRSGRGSNEPAIPSKGRWCTSSVALSRRSSRMRTSIGPENEATSDRGPDQEQARQGSQQRSGGRVGRQSWTNLTTPWRCRLPGGGSQTGCQRDGGRALSVRLIWPSLACRFCRQGAVTEGGQVVVQGLPSVRQGKSRQARSPSLCLLTPVPSPPPFEQSIPSRTVQAVPVVTSSPDSSTQSSHLPQFQRGTTTPTSSPRPCGPRRSRSDGTTPSPSSRPTPSSTPRRSSRDSSVSRVHRRQQERRRRRRRRSLRARATGSRPGGPTTTSE